MSDIKQRVKWIDVARGFAILFVVMHHAGTYERALFSTSAAPLNSIWLGIELLLYHIRLPLFFFISGTLASGYFSKRGTGPRIRPALDLARTYAIWSVILLALAPSWPNDGMALPDLTRIPGLLMGGSVAWYIWAIVICFAIGYATRKLPAIVALAIAIGISLILIYEFYSFGRSWQFLARCMPFYLLGFRFPGFGERIVSLRGFWVVAGPVVLYFSLLSLHLRSVLTDYLYDLAGLGIGLLVVGFAVRRWPSETDRLAWLGQRTLPIYLLHFPIIALLGCEAIRYAAPLTPGHPAAYIFVPLLSAVSIVASLLLYALLLRLGGQRLFAGPPPGMTIFGIRCEPQRATNKPAPDQPAPATPTSSWANSAQAKAVTVAGMIALVFGGWWFTQASQADELAPLALPDTMGRQGHCALWFVGSSSIHKWKTLDEDMSPWTAHNRGVNGATFASLAPLFARDTELHAPEAIVLYAGENDIADGITAAASIENLRRFLAVKDRKFGKMPVFVVSLKPSPTRWSNFAEQARYNEGARKIAASRTDLTYIDIVPLLLINGRPGNFYVGDGIHMNHDGYKLWARAVRLALKAKMAPDISKACDPTLADPDAPMSAGVSHKHHSLHTGVKHHA
jgi:surface polysaccharide O-acyltransferase-like enzyme